MLKTHDALVNVSGRVVPIHRMGRAFYVLGPRSVRDRIERAYPVHGPFLRRDPRFTILPRTDSTAREVESGIVIS